MNVVNAGSWKLVASFTDAWIETMMEKEDGTGKKSHLLQMRGLKPKSTEGNFIERQVASFTDAWIETDNAIKMSGLEGRIFYRCVD